MTFDNVTLLDMVNFFQSKLNKDISEGKVKLIEKAAAEKEARKAAKESSKLRGSDSHKYPSSRGGRGGYHGGYRDDRDHRDYRKYYRRDYSRDKDRRDSNSSKGRGEKAKRHSDPKQGSKKTRYESHHVDEHASHSDNDNWGRKRSPRRRSRSRERSPSVSKANSRSPSPSASCFHTEKGAEPAEEFEMVPEEPLASTTTKVVDEVMQVEDGELKEAAIILPAEGDVSHLPDNTRKHERGVYPRPRVRVDFTYFLQEHKLKKM